MVLRVKARLAAQVRWAREDAFLTQAQLASLLKVSTRTVQNWEAGRVEPRGVRRLMLEAFIASVREKAMSA